MTAAPKTQRLLLVILAIAALAGAALLALWGLQGRAAYFVTPSEIAAGRVEPGVPLRLGGMVSAGSIAPVGDGNSFRFRLEDETATTTVRYRGILPDLFVEGSGAVAEGRLLANGEFAADRILAKHDENYMPPELAERAERATAETVAAP
ncbi:cytochrome c maturation protein CcmE [Sphingomicrobium astaxanthinifaciens]|uniref:cytochrome c maturation protein CcmE n=1 Tax=Sphingomicrobium astaxanthinifaciens TaxID=1227949 RepID=UPI001FCB0024|nr:cytochrome c maturation protein CcmE [Sphingomicrobium astaxanthinifaciens]MCJ7420259.1 cytochrome c maturation protein CcmE [Sphingomicrobium astaxanthinifaciens]